MSRKNPHNGRAHARRNRQPRQSPNTSRTVRPRDEHVLSTLPYRRGHLTDREFALFRELRGPLSPGEHEQLALVACTLRRPFKRLRALDLMRYWGLPLTAAQCRMLPWFAGLTWQQPLPSGVSLGAVALARHLLCSQDVPAFLLEPFAHPERYRWTALHWDLCRLLAVVGVGGGLRALREQEKFWTWVPPEVFECFLQTPSDVPVLEGLIQAFVTRWDGPDWLAKQAFSWTSLHSITFDLPPVLRVAHGLCLHPLPPLEAESAAHRRLAAVPAISRLFGQSRKLPIPDVMPPELAGWHSYELRTADDFEAENARVDGMLCHRFQEAQLGQLSFWSLRREDHSITVEVNVSSMRARQFATYRWARDPEEQQVVALWAKANGLEV